MVNKKMDKWVNIRCDYHKSGDYINTVVFVNADCKIKSPYFKMLKSDKRYTIYKLLCDLKDETEKFAIKAFGKKYIGMVTFLTREKKK